jgi:hypothetical protein
MVEEVAGRHPHEHECQQRNPEENGDKMQGAFRYVLPHGVIRFRQTGKFYPSVASENH